jgi:hypothetical protein
MAIFPLGSENATTVIERLAAARHDADKNSTSPELQNWGRLRVAARKETGRRKLVYGGRKRSRVNQNTQYRREGGDGGDATSMQQTLNLGEMRTAKCVLFAEIEPEEERREFFGSSGLNGLRVLVNKVENGF